MPVLGLRLTCGWLFKVALDDEPVSRGRTRMQRDTFETLVDAVAPGKSLDEKRSMFAFMDRDRSGAITKKEFILHMCDALRFDFAKWHRRAELAAKEGGFLCFSGVVLDDGSRQLMFSIISTRAFTLGAYGKRHR